MMEAVSGSSRDRLLTLVARGEDYSISVSSDEYHSVFTVMDGVLSEFS